MSVNAGNPSIHRAVANLREDVSKSREAVRLFLESQLTELRTGRFLERFFDEWQANPIAQRLMLIRALKSEFLTPAVPSEGDGGDATRHRRALAWARARGSHYPRRHRSRRQSSGVKELLNPWPRGHRSAARAATAAGEGGPSVCGTRPRRRGSEGE